MTLDQALKITDIKVKELKEKTGQEFDGCTLAPELGIHKFCIMHDALRHFQLVSDFESDNLFFKGIMTKGVRYFPIACLYWTAVRIVSLSGIKFSRDKGNK